MRANEWPTKINIWWCIMKWRKKLIYIIISISPEYTLATHKKNFLRRKRRNTFKPWCERWASEKKKRKIARLLFMLDWMASIHQIEWKGKKQLMCESSVQSKFLIVPYFIWLSTPWEVHRTRTAHFKRIMGMCVELMWCIVSETMFQMTHLLSIKV